MDHEAQGVHVALAGFEYRDEAVQGAEEVAALGRIMDQRIGYSRICQPALEVLKMPIVAIRIDGVGFDLIRPVGPIDSTFLT